MRDFSFRPDDGAVLELVYDTYGSPLVPDALVSTFRLGADRIVAAGINPQGRRRVIVQGEGTHASNCCKGVQWLPHESGLAVLCNRCQVGCS